MHKRVLIATAGIMVLSGLGAAFAVPVIAQDASSSTLVPPIAPSSADTATSSSTAVSPSAAPAAASDDERLAAGKRLWSEAACYNCHGTTGGGGHSADFPQGPSLRTSSMDPETMLMVVECGLPGTRMPAWLKGAYTEISCNGAPVGPAPNDVLLSGAFSEDDLKALVDYVQVNFMKKPMPKWSAR
jgi:mono/diheme cytochrome c family protein